MKLLTNKQGDGSYMHRLTEKRYILSQMSELNVIQITLTQHNNYRKITSFLISLLY